jgi:osmotically-inducible protein OsmY
MAAMVITVVRTDAEIQQHVLEELVWDPEIEVTEIGVEVDDGIVTLTGTIDSYAKKLAAERAAFRVDGVRAVANDLLVQPEGIGVVTDTSIARAIANAFEWNSAIPVEQVQITVAEGRVTLEGEVNWQYQRTAAETIVHRVPGVRDVTNLILVRQPFASAVEIKDSIERAFVRNAEVDADAVEVACDDGHVTLTGVVRSWAERQEAQEAAWKARGVTQVTNNIQIRPART